MVKRVLDVVLSAVLLVLALPVLLVSAVVIRMSSPGPALFRQVRMGRGFRTFEILKLRTMADAAGGLAYTLGADPRITPFGRWLRRTKVDELPQLWNVLRGEMSLVGPRPVLPELTAEFRFHYRLLLRVRPGLTDPASLKYSQEARLLEQTRDPMRFFKTVVTPDKISISLEYMDRATWWSDAVTLAMTGAVCCFPVLSAVYGELPDVETRVPPPMPQPVMVIGSRRLPVDACVFSHQLASVEASAEDRSEGSGKPARRPGVERMPPGSRPAWNPLRFGESRSDSTASAAHKGVSSL